MSDPLPLMEDFYSLQGEGFHAGRAAYFVRLAGCDIGCVWCDVKESWKQDRHPKVAVSTIVNRVKQSGARFVVITGGEPALYDLTSLTAALKSAQIEIALETSGAYPIKGTFDWICLSPKKFKLPLTENYAKADELKVIVFHPHDLKWSAALKAHVTDRCKFYLQPEWDKQAAILPLIVDYVKQNQEWTISLQTHKYLNIP